MNARVIVADPPWPIEWRGGTWRKNGRGEMRAAPTIRTHKKLPYATMTVEAIAAMNVRAIAAENAVLLLWAPDSIVINGTATAVARAWGFAPQRFIVWTKRGFGLGTFPRPQHELALFSKRGLHTPRRRNVGSVQEWKLVYERRNGANVRRHSAKPQDFLAMLESVYLPPYVELFARHARLGWSVWGNEVPCDARLTEILGP